jgi:hypothetical protein
MQDMKSYVTVEILTHQFWNVALDGGVFSFVPPPFFFSAKTAIGVHERGDYVAPLSPSGRCGAKVKSRQKFLKQNMTECLKNSHYNENVTG